ncbi:hypothetical protein BDB01DRAFT_98598 [Pilobolus umbonatus]|nr:hypothetical protein BDB01DRAFT_98598 [Pilobolus umbonatus]
MIFPKYYTDQLSDIFLKKESKLPKASGNISYEQDTSMNEADEKGSYNGNASMADEFEESLDDVDGEPLDDVDGEPLDDVDGEPMDDVDGEPMEEDIGHSGNMNDMPLQNDGVIDDMFA